MPFRISLKPLQALVLLLGTAVPVAHAEQPEMIETMRALQYFGHKLQLSLDHDNPALARFYMHEMEEAIAAVGGIESYGGYPIGRLSDTILKPVFAGLEATLERDGPARTQQQFDKLIDACNQCHVMTEHAYIVIRRNPDNPFMQSFAPPE